MSSEAIDIASFLRPRLGLMDLVRPEATFYFVLGYGNEMTGLFFRVAAKDFFLNLICDGNLIIL